MGVFDRLGNLGKGMIGIIKSGSRDAGRDKAESDLDGELERLRAARAKAQVAASKADVGQETSKNEDALAKLKRLHASGLLSDEEYAAKVASASGLMDAPASEPDDEPEGERRIKKTL